ncbi:HlyD family secretion protein [Roseateles koreensis]|uniref:HlyD family efflux transporter periplasmic adaptor subunit n=1 Tax=Roseateles koreensis TaxID=2987526 RepID=A0ABT5KQV2_9BURK|nr:HlyD family efflux transporter periplasmic adaptor subunit [Roseateles koreensis]MDC8785269.1 HlyD family efflux transporter periplasmic adaptor subunit [Roseateles koreensis]
MSASEINNAAAKSNRKTALTAISIAVILGLGAYGVYHWMVGSRVEQTDNAYVNANVVQITPLVGGTVRAVNVDDTDFVKAGQSLVSLDPADTRVALDQAESQLAQTVREVRTLYANNATLESQIRSREADLTRAQSELQRLQADVQRRQPLLSTGAIGKEELDHANAQVATGKAAVAAAQSALQAAQEQLSSNQVLTDGLPVADHPNVQRAAGKLREAYLAQQRTELLAPVDGWVARRSVQLGQRVAAGSPLMAVVGLQQAWVDANFKEGQVARLRIGQPAKLVADVYGSKVEFQGKVVGLSAGTGAAFALLPAQNATGNWIKVVQRVPVRIALDPAQLAAHPLRVGLSMNVSIDVQDQSGASLTGATAQSAGASKTTIYDKVDAAADADVARIIKANLGQAKPMAKAALKKAQG